MTASLDEDVNQTEEAMLCMYSNEAATPSA